MNNDNLKEREREIKINCSYKQSRAGKIQGKETYLRKNALFM
jgi:hypothetical protein